LGLSGKVRFAAGILLALLLFLVPGEALARANVEYPSTVGAGNPFVIRVTSSAPLTGVSVEWQGRSVPLDVAVWNNHYIALGLFGTQTGKVKTGSHVMKITLQSNGTRRRVSCSIRVTPVKYREDHLTLPESMVTPPAHVLARIAEERKAVGRALSTVTLSREWGLPLARPVDGIVTSPYGRRRVLNKKPRSPHGGMDFRAAAGTPVRAALPGRVVLTGDHYYAGKSVYIDSGGGVISHYFHLDSVGVKEGDRVNRGAVIARSGMTGRSTGPHLHFGLSLSGQLVNPEPLFEGTIAGMLEKTVSRVVNITGGE